MLFATLSWHGCAAELEFPCTKNTKQSQKKRTAGKQLMSNELLLLYSRALAKLSFHLPPNPDAHTCTVHTQVMSVCMFADQFNTAQSLSVIWRNIFADLPVTHFRSSWNRVLASSRFIFYLLPLTNTAESLLPAFFTVGSFKSESGQQRYKANSSVFFIPLK